MAGQRGTCEGYHDGFEKTARGGTLSPPIQLLRWGAGGARVVPRNLVEVVAERPRADVHRALGVGDVGLRIYR